MKHLAAVLLVLAATACSDDEQLPTPTIDAAVVDAAPAIDAAATNAFRVALPASSITILVPR